MTPRSLALSLLGFLTVFFVGAAVYMQFGGLESNELDLAPIPVPPVSGVRLEVDQAGVYAVTATQLRDTNLAFETFSADSLVLSRDGVVVPFLIAGDTLYFYAEAVTSTLQAPVVYWLSAGRGLAMDSRPAAPTDIGNAVGTITLQFQENETFIPRTPRTPQRDPWFGPLLFAAPEPHLIQLGALPPPAGPGELTISFWARNEDPAVDPDHHTMVALNDLVLDASVYWDGIAEHVVTLSYPAGAMQPVRNTLAIMVPGDTGTSGEAIYVDEIVLQYPTPLRLGSEALTFRSDAENIRLLDGSADTLVFDISEAARPIVMVDFAATGDTVDLAGEGLGGRYIALRPAAALEPRLTVAYAAESLTNQARGADYIAIVPDDAALQAELEPLLEHRREQGLQVTMVSLTQIYDEFGFGRASADAIQAFITYSARQWSPPPRFVLLVGDASYDSRGYLDGTNPNLLPAPLVYTTAAGYVGSDMWLTMAAGVAAPVMAVGRFPVQTPAQLERMVNKTIIYERTRAADWDARALLVADDEAPYDSLTGRLNSFLAEAGYDPYVLAVSDGADIHDAIVEAINDGVSLIHYAGEGSIQVWGDERVFQADDAGELLNQERLPIFATFTSVNGLFNHPFDHSLAESMLWAENGGVVAAIAPAAVTPDNVYEAMATAFFRELNDPGVRTIGEALRQAKATTGLPPEAADALHVFNLLGDPALRIRRPAD